LALTKTPHVSKKHRNINYEAPISLPPHNFALPLYWWYRLDWIGHILRRNCLLKHVIEGTTEGRIEVTGRRGRRSKKPLDDHQEKRKLKEKSWIALCEELVLGEAVDMS
jgi:hypothetical protein